MKHAILAAFVALCGCRAVRLSSLGESETLRPEGPGAGGSPVVIVAIDGMDRALLYDMLRSGELPGLEALIYGSHHAYFDDDLHAVFPSLTMPGWASAWTGVTPAEHGLPANEFWLRGQHLYVAPAPLMFGASKAMANYTDDYADRLLRVPTIWQRLRERDPRTRIWVSMVQLHEGADRMLLLDHAFLKDLVIERIKSVINDSRRGIPSQIDKEAFDSVLDALAGGDLPDVLALYLPGLDIYAHEARRGPDPARRSYLSEVLDPLFARLAERLRGRDAWVIVVSDHGHVPTVHDDRHALDEEPGVVLEQAGFSVRPTETGHDDANHDAVVAHGGGVAFVYLENRATGSWRDPPRFEQDVLPAARAFLRADATPGSSMYQSVDLVLARRHGEPYGAVDGRSIVPIEQWLARHPHPEWVDVAERLRELTGGPYADHAGDLILVARPGFYFAKPYHAMHGGLTRKEAEVPLIVSHPQRSAEATGRLVRAVLGRHPHLDAVGRLILRLRPGP